MWVWFCRKVKSGVGGVYVLKTWSMCCGCDIRGNLYCGHGFICGWCLFCSVWLIVMCGLRVVF